LLKISKSLFTAKRIASWNVDFHISIRFFFKATFLYEQKSYVLAWARDRAACLSPKWNVRLVASSESPVALRLAWPCPPPLLKLRWAGQNKSLNNLQFTTLIPQLMSIGLGGGQPCCTFVPLGY
jgi:hypothetical protein